MSGVRSDSSLIDIAFLVCTALDAEGTIAVLTGDIDFVRQFTPAGVLSEETVRRLGFARVGQQYVHPDTPLSCIYEAMPRFQEPGVRCSRSISS